MVTDTSETASPIASGTTSHSKRERIHYMEEKTMHAVRFTRRIRDAALRRGMQGIGLEAWSHILSHTGELGAWCVV
jgi:hypothetical protein